MLRGCRAGFLRYSNEPLPYTSRAGFECTPFLCWAAIGRLIRAPAGLLSSTSTHIGGRRQAVGWSLPGCRLTPGRVLGEHQQTYWLLTESQTAPAHMSSKLRPTHVSVLTGAGRLVQRAPPELRPKCDRVDFEAQNMLDSRANVKFGDIRAIHKFGRRPLDMWRRHYEILELFIVQTQAMYQTKVLS